MSRILVTGSAGGLGLETATSLIEQGHQVIVHARNVDRLASLRNLLAQGATAVVGDLADWDQTRAVADQVDQFGHLDAVIHNAGVYSGRHVLPVNIVAPYLLTALIDRPQRLVYLSSGMHRGGRADLDRQDWTGNRHAGSYADSKLFVTTLAIALARLWPDVSANAVDPGWVPTAMGGPNAPDDLTLGHLTQEWLTTSEEPAALTSGGYWFHQQLHSPHPAANDHAFQDRLLAKLTAVTGVPLG
jgi:NAD(P)-dependent dehydrogenase (short-subunit alcohol dehydrogenase family)